jgi:hypothetical protein
MERVSICSLSASLTSSILTADELDIFGAFSSYLCAIGTFTPSQPLLPEWRRRCRENSLAHVEHSAEEAKYVCGLPKHLRVCHVSARLSFLLST